MSDLDRRSFLRGGVAALAAISVANCKSSTLKPQEHHITVGATTEEASGLGSEESAAPTMSDGKPALRIVLREADGSPLSDDRAKTLTARDMNNDPLPRSIVLAKGRARVELAENEPVQLCMRLKTPGFGEVYCYADNDGGGYTKPGTIEFVVDAAKTRLRRVRQRFDEHRDLSVSSEFQAHFAAAERVPRSYESLAHGQHAGEMLALAVARQRIARFAVPRRDFKWGVMVSGFNELGPEYERRVRELFNFATCSWYTWRDEAHADSDPVDYARMDASIDWCLKHGIEPKTFGYLYMARGATPEWIRPIETGAKTQATTGAAAAIDTSPNREPSTQPRQFNPRWNYDRIKDLYARVIRQTMARYNGKLLYAEIMNEAHDKANLWGLNHEQILDMAKMAFAAAREGSPTIQRQMNHCCMWGEYGRHANPDGSHRWSPWQFIKACFDSGIDYDVIGLQLYYPQHDVFEIDRMLDRFVAFNKPIQITEIATASQDGLDPGSMRPRTYAPGWHGPWSPTMQADWAEAMYTLCYSKPAFHGVGWWDFCDKRGRFWPFGGLLDENLQPKEAYFRLQKLQKQWGVARV